MAGKCKFYLLLAAVAVATTGCVPTGSPDPASAEFLESRRVAELGVRIETLEVKLAEERQRASEAAGRCDAMERNLVAERELRQQERIQYELVVRLKDDLQKRLDLMNSETATLKTLQQDVVRLNDIIKERDAELGRLRAELERIDRRADGKQQ